MRPYTTYAGDLKVCGKLQKKHGKSYYFATMLLPKEKRQATMVLYAFFRMPDEIVDNPGAGGPQKVLRDLNEWKGKWYAAYETGRSDEPVLRAASHIFRKYSIPFEYSDSFLSAMISDIDQKRYESYHDLERYMYGSAAVVGLMMIHVLGFSDGRALDHAKQLGYAMQLTNFLRDIREDYEKRGRIYLPMEEMRRFGISENDLKMHIVSGRFISFMEFQVSRARGLYTASDAGLKYLSSDGRLGVRTAAKLYAAILDKIEKNGYDVFSRRAHTNFAEKIVLALRGK